MENFNVYVEGDNDGFNSQNAKFKFKQYVKQQLNMAVSTGSNINNLELSCQKYVKPEYQLKFVSYKEGNVTVKLSKKELPKTNNYTKKDLLKAKIKMMSDKRTNSNYYKAKYSDVVPDDILEMYRKASKESNVPIPEPQEILKHPEQYKFLVESMLSNPEFMKKNTP